MSFQLIILGSNSALPTSQRLSSAQVLNVHEHFFLIDCAEGTQFQLRRYGAKFGRLNHIFISHLHGDHFFGLFGLISSFFMLGRSQPLHIYAHSELKKMIDFVLMKYYNPSTFEIVYHPLNFSEPEHIYSNKHIDVFSFPLLHSIPACGFLFKEKQKLPNIRKDKIQQYSIAVKDIVKIKNGAGLTLPDGTEIPHNQLVTPAPPPVSYAYCSDTTFFPDIVKTIKGVNVLYHEATFMQNYADRAQKTRHSTAADAARIAKMAQAKRLLIGHYSARYKEKHIPAIEAEAQAIFPATTAVNDGDVFDIK